MTNRIEVDAVSGDIDVVTTGEAELSVRTVSGDVALRASTLRSVQASTTSGDIKVAGRLLGPGPFTIVTVSGDMLLAPVGDVRVEMATLSGDLVSELVGLTESGRGHDRSGRQRRAPRHLPFHVRRPERRPADRRLRPHDACRARRRPGPSTPASDTPTERLPTSTPANGAIVAAYDDARLRILRALERGEIDVEEADVRLEALDRGPGAPDAPTDEPIDA